MLNSLKKLAGVKKKDTTKQDKFKATINKIEELNSGADKDSFKKIIDSLKDEK